MILVQVPTFASARVSSRFLSLGCIDSDRCRAIASTPLTLTVSIDSTRTVVSERRPLMQPRRCFFPIFFTARRACTRAQASAYSSLESRGLAAYYLATYVEKRPYRSSPTRRFVTICAPSFRENFRDRATRLSLSKIALIMSDALYQSDTILILIFFPETH